MTNPIIQTDIADILNEIKLDQRKLLEEVNSLKLGQSEIKGKINTVDEKLSGEIKALDTKVDQLDKHISNSEFSNVRLEKADEEESKQNVQKQLIPCQSKTFKSLIQQNTPQVQPVSSDFDPQKVKEDYLNQKYNLYSERCE